MDARKDPESARGRSSGSLTSLGSTQVSPILLAVSDNGADDRGGHPGFMAMVAIAQHLGRPATPTDQAWIESLNGTIKYEGPHLTAITDPAVLPAEFDVVRAEYNAQRLHSGIGYVTPEDEHTGNGPAIRQA
ncbi:MAG: transposase [Austwickia sp.]|nr:integrase core domain-containing protein [Microthrixaceae bacterium]MCO5308408.1 transposase [Austwickia sp.]